MEEVEEILFPMLKPRLGPTLEEDPDMGITINGIGVGMLGILTEGKADTTNILHVETPKETAWRV